MKRGQTGTYSVTSVFGEDVRAFVPNNLPPIPPLVIDDSLSNLLDQAAVAIGRLDGISVVLPDPHIFLYSYVRKEAVLSSQIEGTQSSLSDLLLFEMEGAPGVPIADAAEVSRYVQAMEWGIQQLKFGLPLSLRMIKEVHSKLLSTGRGSTKDPGAFRRSQNWIGGSRPGDAMYVPPPPHLLMQCMGALEKFIHNKPVHTRTLLKAALAHVQFETIHPFLDGNGRVGRLLVTLLFCSEELLSQPMLYLSLYLKEHREQYYTLLHSVRTTGDWESWLAFFLTGVRDTANSAVDTARRLLDTISKDKQLLQREGVSGANIYRLFDHLQRVPITTSSRAAAAIGVSIPTAMSAIKRLESVGIVREVTGGKYGKIYAYTSYLEILNADSV